jgi:hypothetical protein
MPVLPAPAFVPIAQIIIPTVLEQMVSHLMA